jgi:hypothetical protein
MHGLEHLVFVIAQAITKTACDEKPSSFRSPFMDEAQWRRDQRWRNALSFAVGSLLLAIIAGALYVAWRDG